MLPKNFSEQSTILITCPRGLSQSVGEEITRLSYSVRETSDLSVTTKGSLADCMVMNLSLATAHRILYQIDEFTCVTAVDLYRKLNRLPWERVLNKKSYLCITSFVRNPSITDTRFPNVKAKDAIVDRLMERTGARCDSGPERTGTVIHLHWVGNRCSIYFDTSGESLSKRGYRRLPETAPMQETLAAAVVRASVWDGKANFVNPMCGSGTMAIEAALYGLKRPAGMLRREFGFMHLPGFVRSDFERIRTRLMSQAVPTLGGKIIATDVNPRVVESARKNAKAANVDSHIDFSVCEFQDTPLPEGGGVILLNPGYGVRMGEEEELGELYHAIGDFFKRRGQGYAGYVFTGNKELAKHVGLKSKRRIPFFNGEIECRLLEYELYQGSRKKG